MSQHSFRSCTDGSLNEAATNPQSPNATAPAPPRPPDVMEEVQAQLMRWKKEFRKEIQNELKAEVKREIGLQQLFFLQEKHQNQLKAEVKREVQKRFLQHQQYYPRQQSQHQQKDEDNVTITSEGKKNQQGALSKSFCSGHFAPSVPDIENPMKPSTADTATFDNTAGDDSSYDDTAASTRTLAVSREKVRSTSNADIAVLKNDVRVIKMQMHEFLRRAPGAESPLASMLHSNSRTRTRRPMFQMSTTRLSQRSSRNLYLQNTPTSTIGGDGIDGGADKTSSEMYYLENDTFSLMMISNPCSQSWVLGLSAFAFQSVLGIMIANDQLSAESSIFDIPFKVDQVVRVGQVLTIILCLVTQGDVLTSIQTFLILGNDSNWDTVVGVEGQKSRALWIIRILLPTALKFIQGIIVILVCLVVILQSADIIELLKDFTALMVLSDIDNTFYDLAAFGYLGDHLKAKTAEARNVEIEATRDDQDHDHIAVPITSKFGDAFPDHDDKKWNSALRKKRGFNTRTILLFALFAPQFICWILVVVKQLDGTFFRQMYPQCDAPNAYELAFKHFGNGQCYGGALNTLKCGFEGGDCINFNLARPLCKDDKFVNVEEKIGNGVCDIELGIYECDYDGYDCCPYNMVHNSSFGDGFCNGGQMSTPGCAYDGGDCISIRQRYPDCDLDALALNEGSSEVILGDGICQGEFYNSESCGWEYGDCNRGQIGQDILVDNAFVASVLHAPHAKHIFFKSKLSLDGSKLLVSQHAPGSFNYLTMYGFDTKRRMWNEVGDTLQGTQWDDRFGSGLAMNADGSRIAVGAPYNDDGNDLGGFYASGYVKVFHYNGQQWVQIGETFKGVQLDHLGHSIDMTADGRRLAIVAGGSRKNGPDFEGEISVYELRESPQWNLVGQRIYGASPWEVIGVFSMHLSASDGNRIIFRINDWWERTDESSLTKIYEYKEDSNEWTQLGQDIQTPIVGPRESTTSQISADGNRIAVSSYVHRQYAGQVQVFDYNPMNDTWDQIGKTIKEPSSSDRPTEGNGFGWTLALSFDGNHLAVAMVNPDCDGDPDVHTLCATGSVFLYIYDSATRKFQLVPSKRDSSIVSTGMMQARPEKRDRVAYGLQLGFNSDASRLSIDSYDLNMGQGIVNVYDLDELFYMQCAVWDPFQISNGLCIADDPFMSPECNWDGGDCPPPSPVEGYPDCFVAWPKLIGDGQCSLSTPWNTKECGWDGGDCPEAVPIEEYPGCVAVPEVIGNGECNPYWPYNTIECRFDGGDCRYL